MRPPLSAASALRPHSSASIDRHKLPSLHSYNTSLPALYLPSQGHGPSEMYSLRDVGFVSCLFHYSICSDTILQQLPTQTLYFCSHHIQGTTQIDLKITIVIVCMYCNVDKLNSCLHLQPAVIQPCPADSHTLSPSHVQLAFTDQPNCQAVSNGLYTPSTQSAQVVYMYACRET